MLGNVHAYFSDKPIPFVVAFAPGSSTDIVVRLIGEQVFEANTWHHQDSVIFYFKQLKKDKQCVL